MDHPPLPEPVELLGCSPAIGRVREFVRRAASGDGGVLIAAEDGSAVDSLARELHARSRFASGPYVAVDCSADPSVVDRELFGAAHGDGRFDLETVSPDSRIAFARGGVVFLRQVTELPAAAQARLAQIARDREVRIDGAVVETGFRLVASALPGVDADVDARRFRADLYRRLSATRIDLPPLRDRQEDVPQLAVRVLEDVCAARDGCRRTFSAPALALVGGLTWPGNLRELHEVIERVVADTDVDVIQLEHLMPALRLQRAADPFSPSGSLREARQRFERDYIASVLQHHGWHMSNAAQTLGIQRPNLYRKARQLGIPLTRVTE
jgi:two-component system, NtrC family, response regulator GlrR